MPRKTKNNKKKNKFIYWWKKYFIKWSNGVKKKGYPDYQIKDMLKNMALNQLDMINKAPNKKEKPTEEQQEYLNWLEQVAKTGELEQQ